MSQFIINKARELGKELAQSPEYKAVSKARADVNEHAAAKIMYDDFLKQQGDLEKQRAEGKPLTESQIASMQKTYEIISINPYIRDLLMAEYKFAHLMQDVQKALGAEIGIDVPEMPEMPEE